MAVSHIEPGKNAGDDDGRQNEAGAGDQESDPSGPDESYMDSHFSGVRTGDQVGSTDQIKKMLTC